ncbi:MAG: MFS transporter [Synergistaceae bacterium]|nr:MFS transporter [Synergistaceae bacterium]
MSHRKLLFSAFCSFFYAGMVALVIGAALPDLSSAYSLPYSISGALISCYSLGNLASGILSGLAAMYLGQKTAAVIMTLAICLGIGTLTLSGMPAILFTACVLIGLGRGSLITFSQGTVSIITNGRPSTTLMLHASFAAGAIIAPLAFSALRIIDWRAGLVFVVILGLSDAALSASVKYYPAVKRSSGGALTFLRDKGFLILAALIFLYLCCEFSMNGWLVTYMTHKNMSMNFSQAMAALMWLVILAGRLICVWLSRYMNQKNILLVLAAGSSIFFGLMLKSEGRVFIALSVACVGLCMSGISPIIYALSAKYTNEYPLAMGVLFTIGCLGGTLMPLAAGIIAEHWGFAAGMSAILVTFMLMVILSVINLNWRDIS